MDLARAPAAQLDKAQHVPLSFFGERHALRAWSYALWAVFAASALIGVIGIRYDQNTIAFAVNFLRFGNLDANDSWGPMRLAIEHLRGNPDAPVYQAIFFSEKIKFQYPVSSLLLPDLIQRLGGLRWETVISLLNRLSWYSVWITGFVVWRLFVGAHDRKAARPSGTTSDELWVLWPCLALTILFYPLSKSIALGQIQTIVTLLCALALLLWQSDRKALAGLCIGLCCAIKPQWTVLLLWGALRREWSLLATASAVFAALTLLSALLYGVHHYLDYLSVLSFLGQHGEAFFPNQSVNGLLNRLLHNGDNLSFDMHAFPDFHPVAYAGTLAATVMFLGAALLFRRHEKPGVLDLALIMLATTMASPIAWEHHYAILLPIFAVLAPVCLSEGSPGFHTGGALLAAYVLASQRFGVLDRFADTALNVLQSYLFFAAVVVLVLLFRLASRRAEA